MFQPCFCCGGRLAAVLLVACACIANAAPQLIKIGTNGDPRGVTFTNVSRPDARKTVLIGSNPVIQGDNLYAPDLLRVGNRWYCYHGGWLTSGQQYDRV